MDVLDKVKKFVGGSSKVENTCTQDPQTGMIHCQRMRRFEDGTKQLLANLDWQITEDCRGVATVMEEFEDGHLKKLEGWSVPRVRAKCKSIQGQKPSDY